MISTGHWETELMDHNLLETWLTDWYQKNPQNQGRNIQIWFQNLWWGIVEKQPKCAGSARERERGGRGDLGKENSFGSISVSLPSMTDLNSSASWHIIVQIWFEGSEPSFLVDLVITVIPSFFCFSYLSSYFGQFMSNMWDNHLVVIRGLFIFNTSSGWLINCNSPSWCHFWICFLIHVCFNKIKLLSLRIIWEFCPNVALVFWPSEDSIDICML